MERNNPAARKADRGAASGSQSRKKRIVSDGDKYSIGIELTYEVVENVAPVGDNIKDVVIEPDRASTIDVISTTISEEEVVADNELYNLAKLERLKKNREEMDRFWEEEVEMMRLENLDPQAQEEKKLMINNKKVPAVDSLDNKHTNEKLVKEEETVKSCASPFQSGQNLRSPICCIMGDVGTGKTELFDCIRGGEAGGITQQIATTYLPAENILDKTKQLEPDANLNVPGLFLIDAPGLGSFTNLCSLGSRLYDIAILVVDMTHGLDPQTIESLNLLKMRNTDFIVALTKVDSIYGWRICENAPITKAIEQQSQDVQFKFNQSLTGVIREFKEQGLNTELYYKNKEMGRKTFSIVPTSALSGEGIPDLLLLLAHWTQNTMVERLTFSNELKCTVLEVKVVEGHGTTIDVVLLNGMLHEGDQIVVCGLQGAIVTTIRALLAPHPMQLQVKGTYTHHKEMKAAQGIKISAQGLEHTIAGTSLHVVSPDDDLEDIKELAMGDMKSVMRQINKNGVGVYVQASTLGSLEALLEFLKSPEVSIPVSGISIGPVQKEDVMKASVMLENNGYGAILAFNVKVTPEASELAGECNVKIFVSDIIYDLFHQYKPLLNKIKREKNKEAAGMAVFPCVLKIVPNCVDNKDPSVLGVEVREGTAKVGTPICVPKKNFIELGRITSIEDNDIPVDYATEGQKVVIKIIGSNPEEQQKMFGRDFDTEDELVSKISMDSLDAFREYYSDELSPRVLAILLKLKKLLKIGQPLPAAKTS